MKADKSDDKDSLPPFKYRMVLKFDDGVERVVEGQYPEAVPELQPLSGETPRTDAAAFDTLPGFTSSERVVNADFARQLERELYVSQNDLGSFQESNRQAQETIDDLRKELAEAQKTAAELIVEKKQRALDDQIGVRSTSGASSLDTERMDWLERFLVEVRTRTPGGSTQLFMAFPGAIENLGDDEPSNIRAQIDYQRNGGIKPVSASGARMSTCGTCKHWTAFSDAGDVKYHGECAGTCSCDRFVYTGDGDKIEPDGLGYWDMESYSAGFETGRYFGCVHWVKRSDAAEDGGKK